MVCCRGNPVRISVELPSTVALDKITQELGKELPVTAPPRATALHPINLSIKLG